MANEYKKVISDKRREANRLMSEEQIKSCNIAIHTASVAASAAGIIPIPVADAVPITGVQVTMTIALGKIFDQTLSESAAMALISATATTLVGRALIKLIPVAGWIASAAVAAGVTEAIGWTLAVDFANEYKRRGSKSTSNNGDNVEEKIIDSDNDVFDDEGDASEVEKENESLSKDFEDMFGEEEN